MENFQAHFIIIVTHKLAWSNVSRPDAARELFGLVVGIGEELGDCIMIMKAMFIIMVDERVYR